MGATRRNRRWAGLLVAMVTVPTLTVVLVLTRGSLSLGSVLLLYVLLVVATAVMGGMLPAIFAAVTSVLLANWFLTPPFHELTVARRDEVVALLVFVAVAVTVSVIVEVAERRRVAAERSRVEADVLGRFAVTPVVDASLTAVLDQVRDAFGMTSVALLERRPDGETLVRGVGDAPSGDPVVSLEAGPGLRLVADGPELFGEDRRLLTRLSGAAARALEAERLTDEAARAGQLAEVDRLRAALLRAVGHELRTPLAAIKAAVSSLRQPGVDWTAQERADLLATVEESADRLDDVIANLLAMSRLQAGALSIDLHPIGVDEVVARALVAAPAGRVDVCVPDDLPLVLADPGLLERVVVNLVDNARRFSPPTVPVTVEAEAANGSARLRVVDHGPGVLPADWAAMFTPFQRLGDRPAGGAAGGAAGVGLGLAIARGFTEAMGGRIEPSLTPGGGLTMTVTLPVAPPVTLPPSAPVTR